MYNSTQRAENYHQITVSLDSNTNWVPLTTQKRSSRYSVQVSVVSGIGNSWLCLDVTRPASALSVAGNWIIPNRMYRDRQAVAVRAVCSHVRWMLSTGKTVECMSRNAGYWGPINDALCVR
ncbi:hypothetical protein PoB_002107200 [Plakobranchus ocellatus]|uniref:F5/8 type C domain-containing protein n=1 Tax=Plakobranchus ocellatus TaxID=259542 RepID=A0AAV3ZJ59_9GAST|nr:hypothetical protein PoB_002107200 [Plakobranchus ocellatus]